MKFSVFFILALIPVLPAIAQTEFISDNFFPAELEFEELQKVTAQNNFSDPHKIPDIANTHLIADVGFDHYAQRKYKVGDSGFLSIEVITLMDYRAAYSLLTLFRSSTMQSGPPGDVFTSNYDDLFFCHGRRWVRIRGRGISDTLIRRVATSVSNRMGKLQKKTPSLVSHFLETGIDPLSLKYFPGSKSFETYSNQTPGSIIPTRLDMEVAQARYSINNRTGILSLLKFPTPELAEEYFSEFSNIQNKKKQKSVYIRRIGPLLCILEGSFNSAQANDILEPIQYSYSVQWIYDKNAQSTTTWGIPVSILGSVVWSFFFVILLCVSSILVGIGLASFRLILRRYFPKNPLDDPERTDITQLRLP
jgi:hypothetical protein